MTEHLGDGAHVDECTGALLQPAAVLTSPAVLDEEARRRLRAEHDAVPRPHEYEYLLRFEYLPVGDRRTWRGHESVFHPTALPSGRVPIDVLRELDHVAMGHGAPSFDGMAPPVWVCDLLGLTSDPGLRVRRAMLWRRPLDWERVG